MERAGVVDKVINNGNGTETVYVAVKGRLKSRFCSLLATALDEKAGSWKAGDRVHVKCDQYFDIYYMAKA